MKKENPRKRGKANKPAQDHPFKQESYDAVQVSKAVEYKQAYNRWLGDSLAIERSILRCIGQ